MTTLPARHNTGLWSGIANEAVFTVIVGSLGLTVFEVVRRLRSHRWRQDIKDTKVGGPLGSLETWEFGYLFQARAWSKYPPPCIPVWPLAWIKQAIMFPEHEYPALLSNLDSTVFLRFLTGAWFFTLTHILTTMACLLPLHLITANPDTPYTSLNRASLQNSTSSAFLWAHVIFLYWICITWMITLIWITRGALRYRYELIRIRHERNPPVEELSDYEKEHMGWRFRTVMVQSLPAQFRDEKWLQDYFEKYLIKSTLRSAYLQAGWWGIIRSRFAKDIDQMPVDEEAQEKGEAPRVVKVILARKTTALQALLAKREQTLRKLEAVHIKLAQKVLTAVEWRMSLKDAVARGDHRNTEYEHDIEVQAVALGDMAHVGARLDILVDKLGSFVQEFKRTSKSTGTPPSLSATPKGTVWEALHGVPRELLHPYQPLIHLSVLYRGKVAVATDYYAIKLAYLDIQIDQERSLNPTSREATSTAFVTFAEPRHARKAFRFLAFHPRSPDTCIVTPAPAPSDLNWKEVMQSNFRGAFLRDWAVTISVWAFTLIWVIPVTALVGLFSITNIASLFPGLQAYFNENPAKEALISSFLPVLLVSLLVICIQPVMGVIASRGHSLVTTSKLNDTVMCRYWKFLVTNTVFFFSIGTSTVTSFVTTFQQPLSLIQTVPQAFGAAAPFYVGWLIFEMGMHGGLSISLLGFPIWLYPTVRGATTLRRRYEASRPRNYDFSYWLPIHLLSVLVTCVFALLNPLIIPFAFMYTSVQLVVLKHQFLHVFSKAFDGNGFNINHRILRYSCDGLVLQQVIFLALMIVARMKAQAVLSGFLILGTIVAKLYLSRKCRAGYAAADKAEGDLVCGAISPPQPSTETQRHDASVSPQSATRSWSERTRAWMLGTWRTLPFDADFSYAAGPPRHRRKVSRPQLPFPRPDLPISQSSAAAGGHTIQQHYGVNIITQGQFVPSDARPIQEESDESGQQPSIAPQTPRGMGAKEQSKPLVVVHQPTSLWDDSPNYNGTYDNPFYTMPRDDFLWLPRNPTAKLDLDDSVDFFSALMSEPIRGWQGMGKLPKGVVLEGDNEVEGPLEEPVDSSPEPLLGSKLGTQVSRRRSTRTRSHENEDIDLPPVIAARVENISHEHDIEEAGSPTIADRIRPSLGKTRSSSLRKMKSPQRTTSSGSGQYLSSPENDAPSSPRNEVASASRSRETLAPTEENPRQEAIAVEHAGVNSAPSKIRILGRNPRAPATMISSFKALANEIIEEGRRDQEEREKREHKEGESKFAKLVRHEM